MATGKHLGYQCEFINSPPDHFICSKCKLVARKLTFTECCGESYCETCVVGIQQEDKLCQACGKENFSTTILPKHRKQIKALQVLCSMRPRGCEWTGTIGQLDTHLDPDQDNCQYVDTKCPLNCQQTISKNKMEQHKAKECTKRDFVCQHCAFKATYEEVVGKHFLECKYVPLQCPNLCGVTCEREDMEDHLKMCRLEEVNCEFSSMGCIHKLSREEQKSHEEENITNHLTLIAYSLNSTKKRVTVQEEKIQDQDVRVLEKIKSLELKVQEKERKLDIQVLKIQDKEKILEQNFEDKVKMLKEQDKTLKDHWRRLQDLKQKSQEQTQMCQNVLELKFQERKKELESLKWEVNVLKAELDDKKKAILELEWKLKEQNTLLQKQDAELQSVLKQVDDNKRDMEHKFKMILDQQQKNQSWLQEKLQLNENKIDKMEEQVFGT